MAIIRIDPTYVSNGVGSFEDPKNTTVGLTWTAGNDYWFKERTITRESITVGASGTAGSRITLGTYDAVTGEQIQDNTRHAIIQGTTGNALSLSSRAYITVDNLDLRGAVCTPGGSPATSDGLVGLATNATDDHYVYVYRCICSAPGDGVFDGTSVFSFGIQLKGKGDIVRWCRATGHGDLVKFQSQNLTCTNNVFYSDENTNPATADGIACLGTHDWGNTVIANNIVLGDQTLEKQGIYFPNTGSGVVHILRNEVYGFSQSVILYQPGVICRGNRLYASANYGINVDTAATNCVIADNYIDCSEQNGDQGDNAQCILIKGDGAVVTGNTGVGCRMGISMTTGTGTATVKNNSMTRAAGRTTRLMTTVTGWNSTTVENNSYYFPDGAVSMMWSSTTYTTADAYKTASGEATAQFTDPQLGPDGRPALTSPLTDAGVHIEYSTDLDGAQRPNPPSIGALEPLRSRSTASTRSPRA